MYCSYCDNLPLMLGIFKDTYFTNQIHIYIAFYIAYVNTDLDNFHTDVLKIKFMKFD